MTIKGKKQEMVCQCAHKCTRQTKPGIRVRRVSEQAQAWIGNRLNITEVKRPYNRPIRLLPAIGSNSQPLLGYCGS
jgi:hypothetical protein